MKFVLESKDLNLYLQADQQIDYNHPAIRERTRTLFSPLKDDLARIKAAFLFVRDRIFHSDDIGSSRTAATASEVLLHQEGVCTSKALLLAALLRSVGIPTGLCYQKLLDESLEKPDYVLHGLNAVHLSGQKRWLRLDASGSQNGKYADFSPDEGEKVAYLTRPERGEVDYPIIHVHQPASTLAGLENFYVL